VHEHVPLVQPPVQRRGPGVVAPGVVALQLAGDALADVAEQLLADRAQRLHPLGVVDARDLVADGDPARAVGEEHPLAGDVGVVVRARVPDPAVEEDGVAGVRADFDGSGRVGPLDVAARRAVDPVGQVAARHDLEVAAAGLRDIGEPERQLDRQPFAGLALQLAVLAAAILMPLEPERRLDRNVRVHVEVGVVDVHIPAEHRPHERERGRVVDQADGLGAVRRGAEQVHGPARFDRPGRFLLVVHAVQGGGVVLDLGRRQRAADDEVAVLLELGPLVGRHGSGRALVI
jgi:hypothetical protein